MALIPAAIAGVGLGAVAIKIKKGPPQMSERRQASIAQTRAINDYWRNRVPDSFTVETTNNSDYQNFYYDYPRRFIDPVSRRPYWQVGDPGRPNATMQNNPGLRQRAVWNGGPTEAKKRPAGGKAKQRKGTVPSY